MTRAPMSPRWRVQIGAETACSTATTTIPRRGCISFTSPASPAQPPGARDERLGDDQPLDVVRALADGHQRGVAVQALDDELRGVAVAAVDAHRLERALDRDLGGVHL